MATPNTVVMRAIHQRRLCKLPKGIDPVRANASLP